MARTCGRAHRLSASFWPGLLAEPGAAIRADSLIDAIWADEPPRTASASLRTYVSRLRAIVGDRLVRDGESYRLDLQPSDELDARTFEALLDSDDRQELRRGIGLWRGDAFGDFPDVELLAPTARRLDELRTVAIDRSLAADLAAGDVERTIAEAEAHLVHHPLREASWAVLIRALHRSGRSADALRAYQRAIAALADAGLEPSAALRAAEQEALGAGGEPPAETEILDGAGSPKPGPVVELVGRHTDIEQVESLLDLANVVTIHGPGGVGKTSVATRDRPAVAESAREARSCRPARGADGSRVHARGDPRGLGCPRGRRHPRRRARPGERHRRAPRHRQLASMWSTRWPRRSGC